VAVCLPIKEILEAAMQRSFMRMKKVERERERERETEHDAQKEF